MHLIYLDESGNTGVDLQEVQQPVFVLGALLVPEAIWLSLESDLNALVEKFFPAPRPPEFEIHATELINARGYFRQFPVAKRLAFFEQALQLAAR